MKKDVNLKTEKGNKKSVIKKNDRNKKDNNIFKKISKYFKGVGKEIKRIRWTSSKELLKYSVSTLIFVLFFGLYFYGIDWIALLIRSLAK